MGKLHVAGGRKSGLTNWCAFGRSAGHSGPNAQKGHNESPGGRAAKEKTPTPKTGFSIWTLLRTPGRFTARPLPVHFTTKKSVVRPFSVLSKDEIGPESKTGRFLSKAEIWGVGVFFPLSIF